MATLGSTDVARLGLLLDPRTVARGEAYARNGAVRTADWDAAGLLLTGQVAGSGPHPYAVTVRVDRDGADPRGTATDAGPAGGLTSVAGYCTCPVGFNCKHVAALLVATPPPATPAPPADAGPARLTAPAEPDERADWEAMLRQALADPEPAAAQAASGEGALGLQLELVASAPASRRNGVAGPGIRLRPVVRRANGSWVRTGISWSRLDYLGYSASSPLRRHQLELLRELRALHGVGASRTWSPYGEDVVWLESFGSRRLWDLLRQAGELAMPLVQSGRNAGPVQLHVDPVAVLLDARRAGPGLVLRPRLGTDADVIDLDRSLLLGRPAHGIAWWAAGSTAAWADAGGDGAPGTLRLAPLAVPVDDGLAELIRAGAIRIPAGDLDRFWVSLYPALRRRLPVCSGDGSVDLPEVVQEELVLHLDWQGTSLDLSWSLGLGPSARPVDADADLEAAAARQAAVDRCAVTPGLVADTPFGPRLLPAAHLAGLAAARFALDVLPALEAVDGLRLDEHGDRPDFRDVDEAPVVRLVGAESADGDWLDLSVEVTVDGEPVPFHDLFVALANGAPTLLLPSGAILSLDRPELTRLAELIAEARSLHDSPRATARLSRFQSSLWDDLRQLGATGDELGAWSSAVASLAAVGDAPPVPLPDGLSATLRPYQVEGFQWLAARYPHGLGGILADDMGLGKTLQALALICHVRQHQPAAAPFLVVAPTSVVPGWVAEAERFAPGVRLVAVTQTAARLGLPLAALADGAGIVVTSYALARIDHDEYAALPWAGLLLDEAQFLKNPATQLHRGIRRIPAPFKLALTGTPLENSLAELWALAAITAPGLLPRADRFAELYRTPIERHHDVDRLAQLRRRVRPVLLRRRKEDVAADLPDKQEQVVRLELNPRHRKLYETYLQRERQKVLGLLADVDGNRFEILRSLTLLRQAALDPALVDDRHAGVPATKLDALFDMLDEIVADGHRALVFSQFTRFLSAARSRAEAAGIDHCYLDGRTRRRADEIARFRTGDAPVFFLSLKAGGFGLNLAEADYCILLDPWWNPATEAQAVDRVHRIGQTRKVLVYRLVAADTIEDKVMALKERKAQLFDSVLDGGTFASARLAADDLRALLD